MNRSGPIRLAALGVALLAPLAAIAGEWSGYVAAEARGFFHAPIDPDQHGANVSLAAEPEFSHHWDGRKQSFRFVPFLRWDQHDSRRSHVDVRELSWVKAAQAWELRVGVRKLFWGVTESQHLVDVINQTDLVENIDGEDKLGQPMINLALIHDWGTLDLFALTGFRERRFPGRDGRLRTIPPIDSGLSQFESARGRGRVDTAVRWRQTIGAFDIGLAHFHGTARDPRLLPGLDGLGRIVLIPFYDVVDQSSLDLQATLGQWLWKLELVSRRQQGERFTAATGGFEYTLVGVLNSAIDLGLLAEYLWDDRDERAPTPFQDDLFLGARLAFNDAQSTDLLAGVIGDRDLDTRFYNLEASRRIGDHWKLSLELRALSGVPPADPFYSLRRDDYLQIELSRYF